MKHPLNFPEFPRINLNTQFTMTIIFIAILTLSLSLSSCKKEPIPNNPYGYHWTEFVMGADLSYVNQILDHQGEYRDSGQIKDPYEIFRNRGCNLVRLRLWHNPAWTGTVYGEPNGPLYNDLEDVKRALRQAKDLGMAVNLDFHYSDRWADPAHQETPIAWQGLSLDILADSVYQYTYNTLTRLGQLGLMPEMVQIGNEINNGMLLPLGSNSTGWVNLGILLNADIKAVRDASQTSEIKPKIILHVAQPENIRYWFMNVGSKGGVTDFDIIGFSYYSKWSDVPLREIESDVADFKRTFKKEVMCVETAYPWTSEGADSYNNILGGSDGEFGYPYTREGQLKYMKDLTQAIINGGGTGIMVWEPAWITSQMKDLWGTGSAWENCTFFDFQGNTLKGIDFMNDLYQGLFH